MLLNASVTQLISFNDNVDQKEPGCACFAELAPGISNQCFPEVFHRCETSAQCFVPLSSLLRLCVCVCVFHEWCCWKFVCVLLRVWRCTMTSGLHHHCFAKPCFKGFTMEAFIQIIIPRLIAMMELPGTALYGTKWNKTEWKISDTFQEPLCVCL